MCMHLESCSSCQLTSQKWASLQSIPTSSAPMTCSAGMAERPHWSSLNDATTAVITKTHTGSEHLGPRLAFASHSHRSSSSGAFQRNPVGWFYLTCTTLRCSAPKVKISEMLPLMHIEPVFRFESKLWDCKYPFSSFSCLLPPSARGSSASTRLMGSLGQHLYCASEACLPVSYWQAMVPLYQLMGEIPSSSGSSSFCPSQWPIGAAPSGFQTVG